MFLETITHPILVMLRSVLMSASGFLLIVLLGLLVWKSKRIPWLFVLLSFIGRTECEVVTHISEVEQRLYNGKWLCNAMHVYRAELTGFFTIQYDGGIPQDLTEGCNVTSSGGTVSLECVEKPELLEATSLISLRCPGTGCMEGLSCELIHDCEKLNLTIGPDLSPQFCGTSLDAYKLRGMWKGDSLNVCKNETLLEAASEYKRPFSAGTEKLYGGYHWRGVERDNCFCYEKNERSFLEIASSGPTIFYKATPSAGSECHYSSVFTIYKGKPQCIKDGDSFMTKLMVVGAVNQGEMDLCLGNNGIAVELKSSSVKELALRLQISGPGVTHKGKKGSKIEFCSQFRHDGPGCVSTSCGCVHPMADRTRFKDAKTERTENIENTETLTPPPGDWPEPEMEGEEPESDRRVRSRRRHIRETDCYFWGFYCTSDNMLLTTTEEEDMFTKVSEQVDQNTADIALLKGKLEFMARVMQAGFCSNGSKHFQGSIEVEIIKGKTLNVSDWCTEETFREFCETQSISEHNLSSQVRQAITNARNNEKQSVFTECLIFLALDFFMLAIIKKLWRSRDFKLKHTHISSGLEGKTICLGYHRIKKDEYMCRCGRITLGYTMNEIKEKCNHRGESPAVDNGSVRCFFGDGRLTANYMCESILDLGENDDFMSNQQKIVQALTKTDNDPELVRALMSKYPDQPLLIGIAGTFMIEVDLEPIPEEPEMIELELIDTASPARPLRNLSLMDEPQMCSSSFDIHSPVYPEVETESAT